MKFYELPCKFPEVKDTTGAQYESLMYFAEALGFMPVFSKDGELLKFRSGKWEHIGTKVLSCATMIQLHNVGPDNSLEQIRINNCDMDFKDYARNKYGHLNLVMVFAGQSKIVEKIKADVINGRFTVKSHKVQFMDRAFEKHYLR